MNHLPDYTELTAARLENAQLRDSVQALKAALHTEVLKVMRLALIQATISADNEVARLKAEVDGLSAQLVELDDLKAENARLRERVMHLEATWPRDPHNGGKIYSMPIDPLMREAIDSAKLARKEGGAS